VGRRHWLRTVKPLRRCNLSSSDRRLLFGLGKQTQLGKLTVEWPTGTPRKQIWTNLKPNRYYRLVRGEKASVSAKEIARRRGR
jgi:hypothetical protein